MKSRPTIFLSGVSHEFGVFRDAVENEIEMKGCFAENQPGFPPDYRTVEEMLRRKLHDADAVIHIVGFRLGAEPNQRPGGKPRRSYTQLEFDIARELGKPVYVFLSAGADVRQPPKPEERPEDDEARQLQLAHRQAVQGANHLYYFFEDQAELCKLVAEIPPVAAADFHADISRIIKYAPTELIGRDDELKLLNEAWRKVRRADVPRTHVLTFVALGGEGKTSLVAKWAAELAHQNWPGCDAVFAWSFYSQGTREQAAASSDLFLKEALTFFGDPAMAGSAAGAFDKGRRLAHLVGERRALIVLDGLEPLQYAPGPPMDGKLKDDGVAELLKGLAGSSNGLCVVTTRYSVPDLRAYWQTTAPEVKVTRLSKKAGVGLLEKLGVHGTQHEFETLVEDVKGHALTLNLLGTYLHDAYAGDIRKRDRVKLKEADADEQGGHAFRVMDAYVSWFESDGEKGKRALAILRLLGLFDRPATKDCFGALQKAPPIPNLTEALVEMNEAQRNVALTRLEAAKLLAVNRDPAGGLLSLDAHPLLREYFASQLRTKHIEAWRAAHRRLYEHLCATTPDKPQPTLEDLQPLYQAIMHGCQADLHQSAYESVFQKRIGRGETKLGWRVLGAFGDDLAAVACFFDEPWESVSVLLDEDSRVHLLRSAAFRLTALGRVSEALSPADKSARVAKQRQSWSEASSCLVNLAQIKLALGDITGLIDDSHFSVEYADRDPFVINQMNRRACSADAMHQAGQRDKVARQFVDAEEIAQRHLELKLLGGLSGFRHCNLLLGDIERAAWKVSVGADQSNIDEHGNMAGQAAENLDVFQRRCSEIERRALLTLEWFLKREWHLDIALNRVTLGYCWLYRSIFDLNSSDLRSEIPSAGDGMSNRFGTSVIGEDGPTRPGALEAANSYFSNAVDGLRRANQMTYLPIGLLSCAWLCTAQGYRDCARATIDEAWEIAERGPMRLHMADIHLHRARLFFREKSYPWKSPKDDLDAAEKLINECGYHRRDEELADAKLAILGKS